MKILLVGDLHLADKAPSARTDQYSQQILDKLNYVVGLAAIHKTDTVVFAGDIFHVKQPRRTSHRLVGEFIEIVKSFHCPIYIVPGNHDYQNDRIESLPDQPLGQVFRAGASLLSNWSIDSCVFGVPWQQDWNHLPELLSLVRGHDLPTLVVTHAPISPTNLPWEYIDARDWADMMGNKGWCYYGHHHDDHGIYEANGVQFANFGALSRGSLRESDLQRQPAVALWTPKNGFSRVDVPCLPVEEVFKLEEVRQERAQEVDLQEFLGGLDRSVLSEITLDTLLEHVSYLTTDTEVVNAIKDLLEEVWT